MKKGRQTGWILTGFFLLFAASGPIRVAGQQALVTYQGGVALSTTSYDTEAADAQEIPRRSVEVHGLFSPRLFQVLALRLDAGVAFLGTVCLEEGEACRAAQERVKRPDTFAFSGSAAIGLFTPSFSLLGTTTGGRTLLGLYAGREGIAAGQGSGACLTCQEDVVLRGGFFVEPAVEVELYHGFGVGLSYRTYLAPSDLRHRVTLTVLRFSGG